MAGTCSPVRPHVIRSSAVEVSRAYSRGGGAFSVRISTRSPGHIDSARSEGPSCIFVGPVETASQETLEALYRQARDAYYNGKPLILDDMFDRIELKLRWYGSKHVVKYPRCSLRRQSTYADAEVLNSDFYLCVGASFLIANDGLYQEDPSQVFALASVWLLILVFGSSACAVPIIYTICQSYQDVLGSKILYSGQASALQFVATFNGILLMLLGSIIGYPIASASVGALQGLWKNDLVALKGACPSCGEEVFAFVRSDQSKHSPHRSECHVCMSSLEFRTQVEESISRPGKRWVYGRIYLIQQRGGRRPRWA